jgi:SAM-dependent methyltransferase
MNIVDEILSNPEAFWSNRYETKETGWDIGSVSGPIKAILDGLSDKSLRILIPGAGNAWEAEYAWKSGFKDVYVLDISENALRNFKERLPEFPEDQLIHADFFKHDGSYDLILEQTFFCALHPSLRIAYVEKMHKLLAPGGSLRGVLFASAMNSDKPPFGGNEIVYRNLFSPVFKKVAFELCTSSIEARSGNELLFSAEIEMYNSRF